MHGSGVHEHGVTTHAQTHNGRQSSRITKIYRRSHRGCWTCRLRRKKCDEDQDPKGCLVCRERGLHCAGYDKAKPKWMDGGPRQQSIHKEIKATVAAVTRMKRMMKVVGTQQSYPQSPHEVSSDSEQSDNDRRDAYPFQEDSPPPEPSSASTQDINASGSYHNFMMSRDFVVEPGMQWRHEPANPLPTPDDSCPNLSDDTWTSNSALDYDFISNIAFTNIPSSAYDTSGPTHQPIASTALSSSSRHLSAPFSNTSGRDEGIPPADALREQPQPTTQGSNPTSLVEHADSAMVNSEEPRPADTSRPALERVITQPEPSYRQPRPARQLSESNINFPTSLYPNTHRRSSTETELYPQMANGPVQTLVSEAAGASSYDKRMTDRIADRIGQGLPTPSNTAKVLLKYSNILSDDDNTQWRLHLQEGVSLVRSLSDDLLQRGCDFSVFNLDEGEICLLKNTVRHIIWLDVVSRASTKATSPSPLQGRIAQILRACPSSPGDGLAPTDDWIITSMESVNRLALTSPAGSKPGDSEDFETQQHITAVQSCLEYYLTFDDDLLFSSPTSAKPHLVQNFYVHSLLVYMHVITTGAFSESPDIRKNVKLGIQNLIALEDPTLLSKALVWPFCILGCLAGPEHHETLIGFYRSAANATGNPNRRLTYAFKTMVECWRQRGKGIHADWKLAKETLDKRGEDDVGCW